MVGPVPSHNRLGDAELRREWQQTHAAGHVRLDLVLAGVVAHDAASAHFAILPKGSARQWAGLKVIYTAIPVLVQQLPESPLYRNFAWL